MGIGHVTLIQCKYLQLYNKEKVNESKNGFAKFITIYLLFYMYIPANSADPDEQSDQGLHRLQFQLHLLGALLVGKAIFFKFSGDYSKFLGCLNI